jgi:hypothetical protein
LRQLAYGPRGRRITQRLLSTLNVINSDAPDEADWVIKSKVLKLDARANEVKQLPLGDDDRSAFAGVAANREGVFVPDEHCKCVLRFTPN